MKHLVLIRHKDTGKETVGTLHLYDSGREVTSFATVELPWKQNRRNVSCIPSGVYAIIPRSTSKYGDHFILEGIRNRSGILIHKGNYYTQIKGCILIGSKHADINKDGELDVVDSTTALKQLTRLVTERTKLIIVETLNASKVHGEPV